MDSTIDKQKEEFSKTAFVYMNEIYSAALRMARNPQVAEDLTQDVFAKAWKSYHQFTPGTNMRAWLYKILTNTYINEYRKKSRQGVPVDIDQYETPDAFYFFNKLADEAVVVDEDPFKAVVSKFAEKDIVRAMDSLPDGFREAVILSDLQGLSYDEIAKNMNIPLGTVRSRLNRGRRQLQKALWDEAVQSGYIDQKKMTPMKRWSTKLFRPLRGKQL
ncbi:MAG: sigma-70 family RNA polymerase sigma factor [Elusimicrobia bacterium]|nr:sigma-70 family RNA polymerase sigma factor [Candidatus Obscuribacterium magneticum]